MKAKTLHLCGEEIISHEHILRNGERSVEGRVIVRFKDETGAIYECNKVIKFKLQKRK